MRKLKPLFISSVAAIIGLAGCGGSRNDPTEKYFLVAANIKLPYWQTAAGGLAHAAKQLGVQAEMVGPDTYDVQGEVQAFRRAVAKKPAGILVSAADPALMAPEINAAIGLGIPVITMDSDAPQSKRLLFIGTNNREAGVMGGRVVVKELQGKGTVVVYTMPGQGNLEERLHGYKDAFAQHEGIKIAEIVNMKGDPRIAFDRTSEIIVQGKMKPDAFVCLEAESCKEVADVLDRYKVTGKTVVAMDTNKETLNWVDKGLIVATIAQKPFTMAFYGVKVLNDVYHYKPASLDLKWSDDTLAPIPTFIDTGATMIDKSTIAEFTKAQTTASGN